MNNEIIELIEKRLEVGAKKYGETLDPKDGRDWLQESIEEVLDACVYLSAKLLLIKDRSKDNKLRINPAEVTMIHTALIEFATDMYLDGNSELSNKYRDIASKIEVMGKICK